MPKYSQKFKKKAVRLYQQGASSLKVASQMECSKQSVIDWARNHNIPIRPSGIPNPQERKYALNQTYFDDIDSSPKAYWLGFILGDGCINSNRTLTISLQASDKMHLFKFRDYLSSEHPIKCYQSNGYINGRPCNGRLCSIVICSKKICSRLLDIGIEHNKSKTAKPLDIPKVYRRDYFRGLVDADGTVYHNPVLNRCGVDLNGTEDIVSDFSQWLGYRGEYVYRGQSCYRFRRSCKREVHYILHQLYYKADVYLERKYQKYLNILKDQGKQLMLF